MWFLELDESLVDDGLMARGFGVTVVNAAVEWVPPSMRNTASTGPISDADYAASLDESVDDDTTADVETVAVDHAVRQQLNVPLPTSEPVPVPVPAANTATPVVAAARTGAPKMTCRKCRAAFDSRKDLGNAIHLFSIVPSFFCLICWWLHSTQEITCAVTGIAII